MPTSNVDEPYEPPTIVVLGTVADLTAGALGPVPDGILFQTS
jgi:hypothetical protein